MQTAPLHAQEEKRLRALQALSILDTDEEKEFQDIVEIASEVCDTPISLISLVDGQRQWFKARVGLKANETHRDLALCAHAIHGRDLFEIPDADADPRFSDNPLVTGAPFVKFYAGFPIYSENMPIGTVCVIDNRSRKLSERQRHILERLSRQVARLLELRLKNQALERVNSDLTYCRIALENMNEGVVLQDSQGVIRQFNPASLRILSLSEDQLFGRTSMDPNWKCVREDGSPFPGEEHPAMVTIASGAAQNDVIMGVQTLTDGLKWIRVNSRPVRFGRESKGFSAVTTFADITGEKKNQALLIESAKMTSLGQMAGGIAHEINTPLTVILANAEFLKDDLMAKGSENAKQIEKINKIEDTALRIGTIVRGLRTFARDGKTADLRVVSLHALMHDALSFCKEKFKQNKVRLELEEGGDMYALCDPTKVTQILLNLLNNSFDAIQNQPEKWVRITSFQKNERVCFRVTDCGLGISAEVQERLMTPFFTTKPVGQGTGLGLSISRGLARDVGGDLRYESFEDHTSFVLTLKMSEIEQEDGNAK
jgi:two-component system, sensor histidine kinase